jgi:hypothetical protein
MNYIYAIYKIITKADGELDLVRYESVTYTTHLAALSAVYKIRAGDKESVYTVHGAGYSKEYLTKQTTAGWQKETKL